METRDTLHALAQKVLSLSAKTDLNKLERDLLRNYLLRMYDLLLQADEQITETSIPGSGETLVPQEKTVPSLEEIASVSEPEPEEELIEEQAPEEPANLFTAAPTGEKAEESAPKEPEPIKDSEPQAEESEPLPETHAPAEEENTQTLNERISKGQEKNTLADKLMYTPIDNIKSHITLNKKVAFIIGLFNQESDDYSKAIDQLNNADNLQEALDSFHVLKNRYSWTPDNELVKELEMLVRRRYSQSV